MEPGQQWDSVPIFTQPTVREKGYLPEAAWELGSAQRPQRRARQAAKQPERANTALGVLVWAPPA